MNDSGVFTVEEINGEFLNAIFKKYSDMILGVMRGEVKTAAENGKSGLKWDIKTVPETIYYDVMTFFKKQGFNVILDKESGIMNILW